MLIDLIGQTRLTLGHLVVKKLTATNMHKYGMWKLNTNNQALPLGMPPMEGKQKKYNIHGNIKNITRKRL